jgi:hypothetical protein
MASVGFREAGEDSRLAWWVRCERPVGRIFCDGPKELALVARVMLADRYGFRQVQTPRVGVTCVELTCERETFAAIRRDAEALAGILRHNKIECVVGGSDVWADATYEERLEMIRRGEPDHGSGQERQRQVD